MIINILFSFIVIIYATIPSTNEKLTHLSACTKGRITYYPEYTTDGTCNLGDVSTEVVEGYMFTGAANEAFFDGANKCGICYEMVGADGAIRFMVNNLCAATQTWCTGDMIHFDLAYNVEGYLFDSDHGSTNGNVTFRMVACDLTGNIKIKTSSCSVNYYSFTVVNHVIGVKSAAYSFDDGETFTEIERQYYNTFNVYGVDSDAIPTPFKIKITSIADEELVIDIDSYEEYTTIDSGVQFKVPDNEYFDTETLETTTKPDDIDECCDQTDDVATIYDDTFKGIWEAGGWDNTNTVDYTTSTYKGLYCVKTQLQQYGGFQLLADHAVNPELYSNLTFYVKSDTACDDCLVLYSSTSHDTTQTISIEKASTWQYVSIPMEALGNGGSFRIVTIQNYLTTRNYYFDEIKWIPTDVDSSICADKYLNNGLNSGFGISVMFILMILIISI